MVSICSWIIYNIYENWWSIVNLVLRYKSFHGYSTTSVYRQTLFIIFRLFIFWDQFISSTGFTGLCQCLTFWCSKYCHRVAKFLILMFYNFLICILPKILFCYIFVRLQFFCWTYLNFMFIQTHWVSSKIIQIFLVNL